MIKKLCENVNEEVKTPAYGMDVYLDYENLVNYYDTFKIKILSDKSKDSEDIEKNINIIDIQKEVKVKV